MIYKPLFIPALPGSYILHLRLVQSARFAAGKLGLIYLPAGDYFYCGSARGPGGLRARLGRHLLGYTSRGKAASLHWHIDYLRILAQPVGFCYQTGQQAYTCAHAGGQECAWSQALACLPGASILAPGFGSSDCRWGCRSHLVKFGRIELPDAQAWQAFLGETGEITAGGMLT